MEIVVYIPSFFEMSSDDQIHHFMRAHSFGVLVTQGEGGLAASHLPLLLDPASGPRGSLFGHMARANPQWRDVSGEALAIFSGPHAYISPTWYESQGTVPTWNYVAVHAHGSFGLVEDRDDLREILTRSVAIYERRMPRPWSYNVGDPDLERMLPAIVGFRIEITRLEGKAKLGQNQSEDRRRRVISALENQQDEDSQAIAGWMKQTLPG
jgi:transcriptional regulator